MGEPLSASIARRYLISKKSHSAVGAISAVSVCAMAVATAAIICVLSVFNGFRNEIGSRLDTLAPDVLITPAKGKVFTHAEQLADSVSSIDGVALATVTLTDNALVICDTREMPITLKGVIPSEYSRVTAIKDQILDQGRWFTDDAADEDAVIAIGTASQSGALPESQLLLFAPRRIGRVNLANPAASFLTDSVAVDGIYRTDQQEYDENGVFVTLATARKLLQYNNEASAIEIKATPGTDAEALSEKISKAIGDSYIVRDRARQQQTNFRMVAIEKWVSYLLLFFILAIASFNLISSLSMLVLEKEQSLSTLVAIGMSRKKIGAIFAWESIYVSLIGGISGVILGILLCLGQQHFGWIKLHPESPDAIPYPVEVIWTDVIATLIPVLVIGAITALVTARFAARRSR